MRLLEYLGCIILLFLHWMGRSCFDCCTEVMFVLSLSPSDVSGRLSERAMPSLSLQIVDVSVLLPFIENICTYPTCDNLFSIFSKSFPTHRASQYKYVPSVGPAVYHLFTFCFFSPSWPLSSCTASVTMFALITSKPFRSPLSSLFCAPFLYFYPAL